MAVKTTIRTPMPIKMRAKQFTMFDALKGLTDAIAESERQYYLKKGFEEEMINKLNAKLSLIQKGEYVMINYYCHYCKQYRVLTGIIKKIDKYEKIIMIGNIRVSFTDLADVRKIEKTKEESFE